MRGKTFGKGTAWYKNGIHVLSLRGTYVEMAAQHGALLKEQIHKGALPYLGTSNHDLVAHSPTLVNRPLMKKLALAMIRNILQKPMLAQIPRNYLDEMRALADTSGLSYELCEQSILQADTLGLLIRYFLGRHVLGEMAGGLPGCTSIVALGEATASGGVIHARNMDYPVVGRWDAFPTISYFDPEGHDRGQRYVAITSAGVHTAGVTALNESGITLSAHFHCAKAMSPFGVPIQMIGSEVIKRARTLGQAIDLARDLQRAGTWSLVVSSARENTAAVIEMVHGKVSAREPMNNRLIQTNHFHTPEFHEREVLLAGSIARDFVERYGRAEDLLEQNHGRIDRKVAARILGDHFDRETQQVRAQGNTISLITTVTSMISEMSEGRFWMANSHESPTCLGDYAGFRFDESFEGFDERELETFSWSAGEPASEADAPVATTILGTPKHEAFRLFRKAYIAFHIDHDTPSAIDRLEEAVLADSEEGHYHLALGHLRMRMHQPERALEAFREASRCRMTSHMSQVARLFIGHALDCTGRRDQALEQYRLVAHEARAPQLREEAQKCLRRPYRLDRASRITFDLQFCDPMEYA